jgi:hypothetical protein
MASGLAPLGLAPVGLAPVGLALMGLGGLSAPGQPSAVTICPEPPLGRVLRRHGHGRFPLL